MIVDPEEIMAYVDGEIDEAARARITLAALTDVNLAEQIASERALRERLQTHFMPITKEPVPPEWVEEIRGVNHATAGVVDIGAARERKSAPLPPARRWNARWAGAAMAASLVVGVFVGAQWNDASNSSPIVARNGALVASGSLARTLDNQLASTQDGASIRVMASFRRAGGDICRAFASSQASGIACHDAGAWQVQHLLPGGASSSAVYQQASSHDAELMTIAQGMAVGAQFDATQEREARANGWR